MYLMGVDCSAETHFGADCDRLLGRPYGYIKQHCGKDLTLKIPYYGTRKDPLSNDCSLCLVEFLDGSAVAVRYRNVDIVDELDRDFKPPPNFYTRIKKHNR